MTAPYQTCTPRRLAQAALGSTIATLYTAPARTVTLIKDIDLANATTSAANVTLHIVPSGSTAGAGTQIIPGVSLAGNATLQWSGLQVLEAGDTIQALGSGITATISGAECI